MSAAALIADCQKRLEKLRGGGGWFSGSGAGTSIDHGTYRSVIGQYHDRVFYEGRVTWGALVQAQAALYAKGDWDSTGALVYSFDRHFDGNPQQLERIAANVGALKNAMPKDALLVAFAAEVRNDTPREIDRLVPLALTAGKQVRYETIYIQRHRLPTSYLAGQFFPIIISTSQPTQPMLLPLDAWSPQLVEMWKAAEEKKRVAQQAAHENRPISRQPQAYDDGGYGGTSGGRGGGAGVASPGLSFGANAVGQNGTPAGYGNGSAYGNSNGYGNGNSTGYGQSNGYGGGQNNSRDPYTAQPAYNSPPAQPTYASPAQPATYSNHGQTAYSGQGYAAPAQPAPAPTPAPAPRLDPEAEAFAQKPLQLTAAAAGSLKLSAGQPLTGKLKVRVSVAETGHRLDLVAGEPNPTTDFVYDSGGVTLVVDVSSARNLTGVQVDFGPSPHGIGFVFRRVA